jgi:bifunctional non-homologous end joining protein LigD
VPKRFQERDLRPWPLVKRNERLQEVVPESGCRLLYLPHLERTGVQLFQAVCRLDLEGIVAKRKDAPYRSDERESTWIKIKNPQYSQMKGRRELFTPVQ